MREVVNKTSVQPISATLPDAPTAFTVSTTSLVREPGVLRLLHEVLIPTALRGGDPVHIASIGCSQGDELASILMHNWEVRDRLKLIGFDSNPKVLALAATGKLSSRPCNVDGYLNHGAKCGVVISPAVVAQCLEVRGDTAFLTESALQKIHFIQADLLTAAPPGYSHLCVIANVLMHYDTCAKARIVAHALSHVVPGGTLIVVDSFDEKGRGSFISALRTELGTCSVSILQPGTLLGDRTLEDRHDLLVLQREGTFDV